MVSGRTFGASNMTVRFKNEAVSCSAQALEALLVSSSSAPHFNGSNSMVDFEGVHGKTPDISSHRPHDHEEICDEDFDECFHQREKKRRLNVDQVKFLEKNFEVENKLEPERKFQLARDLGLQPRQIAIWFQNRRARWKIKLLEKDYEVLKASYTSLKDDYENLVKEKEKLKAEVLALTEKLILKGKGQKSAETSKLNESNLQELNPGNPIIEVKDHLVPKLEELSSAISAVLDSESPRCANMGHSTVMEPALSSNVFEPDQSDISHAEEEEEDNLSRSMLRPSSTTDHYRKSVDSIFPDPPVNSCGYGFPLEDQGSWYWPY